MSADILVLKGEQLDRINAACEVWLKGGEFHRRDISVVLTRRGYRCIFLDAELGKPIVVEAYGTSWTDAIANGLQALVMS